MKLHRLTRNLVCTAILAALALALSALEGIFTPLLPPGVKPGLANIAVMVAALLCGAPSALFIALCKALFALATRGAVAFLMSLSGGLCATGLMLLLFYRAPRVGLAGISVLCALMHNAAQLTVAALLLGRAVLAYAPLSLLLSVPCGIVTGAILAVMLGPLGRALSFVARPEADKNTAGKGKQSS